MHAFGHDRQIGHQAEIQQGVFQTLGGGHFVIRAFVVTAQALRNELPEFLAALRQDPNTAKFLAQYSLAGDAFPLYEMTG